MQPSIALVDQLLAQARGGSGAAVEELLSVYRDYLRSLASHRLGCHLAGRVSAREETPSKIVSVAEEASSVQRLLTQLPEDYRLVIQWRQLEGIQFNEIAKRLNKTMELTITAEWLSKRTAEVQAVIRFLLGHVAALEAAVTELKSQVKKLTPNGAPEHSAAPRQAQASDEAIGANARRPICTCKPNDDLTSAVEAHFHGRPAPMRFAKT